MLSEQVKLDLLRFLQENPQASQREIAKELDLSLGRVNYCLRALIEKGWVKAKNFKNSKKKAAYMYNLTPGGIAEKASVTRSFLATKQAEYKALEREIQTLREEVRSSGEAGA